MSWSWGIRYGYSDDPRWRSRKVPGMFPTCSFMGTPLGWGSRTLGWVLLARLRIRSEHKFAETPFKRGAKGMEARESGTGGV